MSDNLNNEIKTSLFNDGSITVLTSGGDVSPALNQPTYMNGQEKYNLNQRDYLAVLLFADLGTVVAGATITAKYYARMPNAIIDAKLLATETKTLAEIAVGNHLLTEFSNAALAYADYVVLECTLKQASGSSYQVSGNTIVKKKIDEDGGGGGGTANHNELLNRDLADQHPLSAVTGLSNKLTSLSSEVFAIGAGNTFGGTSPAYQSIIISTVPRVIKKLNNTNTYAYTELTKHKAGTQIRYRAKLFITENTTPTAGQTEIISLGATSLTHVFAGTEIVNQFITTDWSSLVSYNNEEIMLIASSGTYAQSIGLESIEIEYERS
jgi:hypothetical protein